MPLSEPSTAGASSLISGLPRFESQTRRGAPKLAAPKPCRSRRHVLLARAAAEGV